MNSDRIRLWGRTLADRIASALSAHLRSGTRRCKVLAVLAYLLAFAAVGLIGRFELHTDDDGVVIAFVLASSFLLGCLHPRRAWLWSCVGLVVPIADYLWASPQRPVQGPVTSMMVVLLVLLVGSVGSWSALLLRKAVRAA